MIGNRGDSLLGRNAKVVESGLPTLLLAMRELTLRSQNRWVDVSPSVTDSLPQRGAIEGTDIGRQVCWAVLRNRNEMAIISAF